jgi:hypothetical protein
MDCHIDTNKSESYYMVRDGLWLSVNRNVDGMLCLPCLERRLGRSLRAFDFTRAPINERQARVCADIAERLSRRARQKIHVSASRRRRIFTQ